MILRTVVTTSHAALGGVGTNTWHIRVSEPPIVSVGDSVEGAMSVLGEFYDEICGLMPDSAHVTWDGSAVGVGPDEGESFETAGWDFDGEIAGGCLPPSQCIVVGWTGESGDASKKGRSFIGPISHEHLQDNGTPTAGALTLARTTASDLVQASKDSNAWAFGVWSRQEEVIRDFVGSRVRNQFACLRSRRD